MFDQQRNAAAIGGVENPASAWAEDYFAPGGTANVNHVAQSANGAEILSVKLDPTKAHLTVYGALFCNDAAFDVRLEIQFLFKDKIVHRRPFGIQGGGAQSEAITSWLASSDKPTSDCIIVNQGAAGKFYAVPKRLVAVVDKVRLVVVRAYAAALAQTTNFQGYIAVEQNEV